MQEGSVNPGDVTLIAGDTCDDIGLEHEFCDSDIGVRICAVCLAEEQPEKGRAVSNPSVLVSLPRELVERLAPGALDRSEKGAAGFSSELERDAWFAGAVGKHVEVALTEIMVEANERRKALLRLLDNVVQNGEA